MQKILLKVILLSCKICQNVKYQRYPQNPEIGKMSTPNRTGKILHVYIFSTDNNNYHTCIKKFLKFATVQSIPSMPIIDIKESLMRIMNIYKDTKGLVCNNEKCLKFFAVKSLLNDHFNVSKFTVPQQHRIINGQVRNTFRSQSLN